MAHNTEIITAAEVKSNVLATLDFDENLLSDRIIQYQRKYVRALLGDDFYDQLLTEVAATSLTAENSTLLTSYIKPMLSHYIMFEELPYIQNQIGSRGVRNPLDDISSDAGNRGMGTIRNKLLADGDLMKENLIQYIKDEQEDNSSAYSLYDTCKQRGNNKGFISY